MKYSKLRKIADISEKIENIHRSGSIDIVQLTREWSSDKSVTLYQ